MKARSFAPDDALPSASRESAATDGLLHGARRRSRARHRGKAGGAQPQASTARLGHPHSEFGHYGHDNQHMRHPIVIAGGGGRTLRLGRYLRLRDIQGTDRVPHNKLLVSLAHAMGRTEINYFGDRALTGRAEYQGPLVPLMA